jgi:DNA-binding NarL/FixJ family response regulator
MRIVVADSQAGVRFAVRTLLERQRGVQIVSESANSVKQTEGKGCTRKSWSP